MVSSDVFVSIGNVSLDSYKERAIVFHVFKEVLWVLVDNLSMLGCYKVTNLGQFCIVIYKDNFTIVTPGRTSSVSSR